MKLRLGPPVEPVVASESTPINSDDGTFVPTEAEEKTTDEVPTVLEPIPDIYGEPESDAVGAATDDDLPDEGLRDYR